VHSTTLPTAPSQQYWSDRRWVHDNYAQLVTNHPNQWIAVHRGCVLASGVDLATVENAARLASADSDIVFQFIDDGSLIFSQ
jgi:hypothetical protein